MAVGGVAHLFDQAFDLRYERIYAYLQDDVTRRRPTVELVLNVLCESSAEKRPFTTTMRKGRWLYGSASISLASTMAGSAVRKSRAAIGATSA